MTAILPNERLSHFLRRRSDYAPVTRRVKYSAFVPYKGEVSVFRTSDMLEINIWEMADQHVRSPSGNPVKARADIESIKVREVGLQTVPDEPPPRHAIIVGWPDPGTDKQQEWAVRLAEDSTLQVRQNF